MHSNIEKLMAGDQNIPRYFSAAKTEWVKLLSDISTVDVAVLADRLSLAQGWFEQHCGGRWDGQEVMVWTGFASIYSTHVGYDRSGLGVAEAAKLLAAFQASMVSLEVKQGAKRAAESYHVS